MNRYPGIGKNRVDLGTQDTMRMTSRHLNFEDAMTLHVLRAQGLVRRWIIAAALSAGLCVIVNVLAEDAIIGIDVMVIKLGRRLINRVRTRSSARFASARYFGWCFRRKPRPPDTGRRIEGAALPPGALPSHLGSTRTS